MIERYAMLTLIEVLPERSRGGRVGLWRCDCGTEKAIPFAGVKGGHAKSCGCLRVRHGKTGTPEYVAWYAMRSRCSATAGPDYESYAARGIGICDRWRDFNVFLADIGPRPGPGYSLGRRDNNVGYQPDNCRWETPLEQQRNTRASMVWTIRGETFPSCRSAAVRFAVDQSTIRKWAKTREDCDVTSRY